MARETIIKLVDDLDGSEADRTVEFGLDGLNYTIDLSEENAGRLRNALDPYLAVAVRAGREQRITRPVKTTNRVLNQQIRMWASRNGFAIKERGRVPADVIDAYEKAAA